MLEHGILNLPLSHKARGGDTNQQLDAYKKEQDKLFARSKKLEIKELKAKKQAARLIFDKHFENIAAHYSKKYTKKAIREMLDGWCKWQPQKMIDFFSKFEKETSTLGVGDDTEV